MLGRKVQRLFSRGGAEGPRSLFFVHGRSLFLPARPASLAAHARAGLCEWICCAYPRFFVWFFPPASTALTSRRTKNASRGGHTKKGTLTRLLANSVPEPVLSYEAAKGRCHWGGDDRTDPSQARGGNKLNDFIAPAACGPDNASPRQGGGPYPGLTPCVRRAAGAD